MTADFLSEARRIENWQEEQGWKVRDPFTHLTDSKLFIGFDDLLTKLYHFAAIGKNYAVIYGHYGYGKTIVLKKLSHEFSKKYNVILFENPVTKNELKNRLKPLYSNRVLSLLGLQRIDDEDFHTINNAVKKKTVLIFDEAHSLDKDVFSYVRSLSEAGTSFTIIFAGKPELFKAKEAEQRLPQYIIDRLDISEAIRPLNFDESLELVKRRVEQVAVSKDYLFDDDAILYIADKSKYIPRGVLENCSKFVELAMQKNLHKVDYKTVEKYFQSVVKEAAAEPVIEYSVARETAPKLLKETIEKKVVVKAPERIRKESRVQKKAYSIDKQRFMGNLSPLQARIVEYLFENEPRTSPEIASGINDKYDTVRHMLKRLQGKYGEKESRKEISELFPLVYERKNPNGKGYVYGLDTQTRKIMSLD